MKVRCKKFINAYNGQEFKSTACLKEDKKYIVLGIARDNRTCEVYIEDTPEQFPGYFDIKEFEIISNFIPSNWVTEYVEKFECLSLYPKAWLDIPDFWDRFVDDEDPEMIALYERERDKIYEEEPK